MRLPKKFNIFGVSIPVSARDLRAIGALGIYQIEEKKIQIDVVACGEELDRVLLHEFLHAVLERTSLTQVISYPNEEIFVDMVSKAIVENFTLQNRKTMPKKGDKA